MFDPIILRRISTVVLFAFTSLTLQPLQAVAQSRLIAANSPQTGAASEDEQYARLLDDIQEGAKRGAGKAGKGQSTRSETKTLRQQAAQLQALQSQVDQSFSSTEAQLRAANASPEILARHNAAVAQYQARQSEFKRLLKTLEDADDQEDEARRANGLAGMSTWLEQNNKRKAHTPLDPGKLPWGAPKATPRMPAETRTAWYQNLTKDLKVQFAQAGGLTNIGGIQFTHPPEPTQAPQVADLAETPDVQLTPAIRAKAKELGNNPVAITNWVRNTVQYLPTWGSIQGADGTLKTLRGNAFDTASLTIALLRASSIPARYQFGTIDLPAEQVMNWVGGVQKPEAALDLMYQGGIAARGLIIGGRISTIRMEHVWVNAYVNWTPSRGNKQGGGTSTPKISTPDGVLQHVNPNGNLNAWGPLDTSFKQYNYVQGMDLKTAVPLDASALLTAAQQGATVTPSYAQNLNQTNLQAQHASYQSRLKVYIDSTPTGAASTLDDVLGSQRIQTRNYALLAGTLPYAIVANGNERAEVPDSQRWKVALRLYQSDNDLTSDSPSMALERPLAQLNDKRLAVSFEPATPADQAIIDSAAQAGQTSFSAYLTRYAPKIKLDFDVLGTGYAQQLGVDGKLVVVMKSPSGEISRDYKLTSGDTAVLSLNPAGTPADKYTNRARDYAMNELDTTRYGLQVLAEEMLHQLGLAWWAQKYVAQDSVAAFTGVVQYALPSHTLLLAPVSVRYFFGVPRSAAYKTRAMDAKLDHVILEHKGGDATKRKEFVRAAGKFGSYLEGAVFDQAFSPFTPSGVSTISMLGQAHTQGLKVYTLKPGDEALVAQLNINPDVQSEISNALAVGREVTVPQQDVTWGGYTGLGYIIEDPGDGSAAYQIDGGRSGAEAKASDNVIPIPAMPDSQLIGILLNSQLRKASAKLAVDASGMIVGLVLPAVAIEGAAVAALLEVLSLLMMLSQGLSSWVEQTYPRDTTGGTRWRKYTRFQDFIVARSLLYASNTGTFGGGGVYVADAYAEEQRGVNCATMSPIDIATRFQIPNPIEPLPSEITGFVDIIELRKGYLKVRQVGPNTAGQLEYLITKPIILVPELRPTFPVKIASALVLTPGVVEIDNVCTIK